MTTHAPVRVVEVTAQDLTGHGTVFCPSPVAGMKTWDTHPRVALDVARLGHARCPYCGTEYRLKEGAALTHSH
ncbi:MAG: hypothetical protein RLZZ397_994 [Pseudomonadota bacterium]|jgi:uncharacterized Zn-finger protein